MTLRDKKCVPCEVGAPTVTDEQAVELSKEIPEWKMVEVEGVKQLKREFSFPNYIEGIYFVDRVAAEAESEGHHPQMCVDWGKVAVSWWTHKIKGLHQNDFVMAAKTDEIFESSKQLD